MLGIMAGMAQKDSYAATQLCLAVLLVTIQLALCPSTRRQAQGARHLGRYGSEGQLFRDAEAVLVADLCSGLCLAGSAGDDTARAVSAGQTSTEASGKNTIFST